MASKVPYDKVNAKEEINIEDYHSRWEQTWAGGLERGQQFDKSGPSPCLLAILSHKGVTSVEPGSSIDGPESALGIHADVRGKRVVVPGCGRGYDIVAFVQSGASECIGLELSKTAVIEGNLYLKESSIDPKVGWLEEGDFLKDPIESSNQFDAGYDYTFLCAMHPSQRQKWAEGWARSLVTGGLLITMAYPVDPSRDPEVGPPFPLTPEIYQTLLVDSGLFVQEKPMQSVPQELSHDGRGGNEMVALFKRV